MLEQLENESNSLNSDEFDNGNNLDPDNNFGLVKPGQIKNFANILKKLVKYDRDLFDIFSRVKMYKVINKSKQVDTSKTVEEKIDCIMNCYERSLDAGTIKMSLDTGYCFDYIFCLLFEIAEGKDNFGYELIRCMMPSEQEQDVASIVRNFDNSAMNLLNPRNDAELSMSESLETKLQNLQQRKNNYENAKKEWKQIPRDTLVQIKDVLGITNEKNRTSGRYVYSFLKNIFLDLTLINLIRKIFFLNKIKVLQTELKQMRKPEESKQTEEPPKLKEVTLEAMANWVINDVLKRISKKNNIQLLILDAVVTITLSVLFACSLIFDLGTVLNLIFLVAWLALIVKKGIKQYWQECRKHLATKASECLHDPKNDKFAEMEKYVTQGERLVSLTIDKLISNTQEQIEELQKPKQQTKTNKDNLNEEEI